MSPKLRVNPIACKAHGLCIELFPEWIRPDDWGYPVISERPIPPELTEHAERAAAACPTVALLLHRELDQAPGERPSPADRSRS